MTPETKKIKRPARGETAPDEVEFLERSDLSELIEKGEEAQLHVRKTSESCPNCGKKRLRKRIIDVPLMGDRLVLKRARVVYCPDCKMNFLERESLRHFINLIKGKLYKADEKRLYDYMEEGLRFFEQRWKDKVGRRRVLTFYFPSETTGKYKNAHVSIREDDPLARTLSDLSSATLRDLLGLQYYEELKRAADAENRTISQFIKSRLASIPCAG